MEEQFSSFSGQNVFAGFRLNRFRSHPEGNKTPMPDILKPEDKRSQLGVGGWLAIAAMGVALGLAIWFAFWGWNLTDAVLDTNGRIALILGAVFSMLVGGGLMALLFWS